MQAKTFTIQIKLWEPKELYAIFFKSLLFSFNRNKNPENFSAKLN